MSWFSACDNTCSNFSDFQWNTGNLYHCSFKCCKLLKTSQTGLAFTILTTLNKYSKSHNKTWTCSPLSRARTLQTQNLEHTTPLLLHNDNEWLVVLLWWWSRILIPKIMTMMIICKLHTITQINHILALTTTWKNNKNKTSTYKDVLSTKVREMTESSLPSSYCPRELKWVHLKGPRWLLMRYRAVLCLIQGGHRR